MSPRDSSSGLPTGKRQHKPIAFTMDADTSALRLTQALIRTETLSCRFRFVRRGQDGEKSQYLTVTLTYQKVNWRWNEGSPIEVEDDWETPVS